MLLVNIALLVKVLVVIGVDVAVITNNRFNLDEYNITNYCINTLKAVNNENNKFILFKDKLELFHNIEELYENNVSDFISYISYCILINCITNNKNISSIESYFYDVIKNFCAAKEIKFNNTFVARSWVSLVKSYSFIIELSSNPNIKNIQLNELFFVALNHINVPNKQNNNYYFNIPIIFNYENSLDVLILLPKIKTNIQYRLIYRMLIKLFKTKLKNIHVFEIGKVIEYTCLNINENIVNLVNKQNQKEYIDFNKINSHNCNSCYLNCNFSEMYKFRYNLIPFNPKKKKIEIINV